MLPFFSSPTHVKNTSCFVNQLYQFKRKFISTLWDERVDFILLCKRENYSMIIRKVADTLNARHLELTVHFTTVANLWSKFKGSILDIKHGNKSIEWRQLNSWSCSKFVVKMSFPWQGGGGGSEMAKKVSAKT